jgi:hypothetical protein
MYIMKVRVKKGAIVKSIKPAQLMFGAATIKYLKL